MIWKSKKILLTVIALTISAAGRFEYFEALRNPRTTGKMITDLEEELWALEDKIYSQAPLGCEW